ncbi:sensor histidine kinase [Pseudonocardia humida]|uniref:histidine kinase n=1 Tax=Pseudonocardia humida TaxID=2800819 RepID=A0ABT1A6A6_9PSEU|nr:histidine kinase [Pseudonocardia humida]MCO1658530.1 sensor histidine kinase [Pseudonocardia humida]
MRLLGDDGSGPFPLGERGADLLLWCAAALPVALAAEPAELRTLPGVPVPWLQVATVLALGAAVAVARRRPVVAAAVPAVLGLAAAVGLTVDSVMIAQVLLAFLLGRRSASLRTGLLFFVGVCLAGLVVVELTPDLARSTWPSIVESGLPTIVLPVLAGRYVRQHDELVRAGWELAGRLERERDLVGERTRLRERSRIAADMHDSLGHDLSLIALRAAALQVRAGVDGPTRAAAAELRESAATATERLRETVRVLREDREPAPVLPADDTVVALVERARASGVAVALEGGLDPLPPIADRAAYRVVQEALTNATRHAPGAAVTVRLSTDATAGEAVVSVRNEAPPAGPLPEPGPGGSGLVGLDERVRLAGGRVRAGPSGHGFEVTARLPLTPGAAATPQDATRELDRARRRVRRSAIEAIWVPTAAALALVALTVGYDHYTADRSVLDPAVFQQLRTGQGQESVQARLPPYQAGYYGRPERAPADPPDTDECRFYATAAPSAPTMYRVCFTDGALSHAEEVPLTRE